MKAVDKDKVIALLKKVYPPGVIDISLVWEGYSADTRKRGWHILWFYATDTEYLGETLAEVENYLRGVDASSFFL